MRPAQGHCAFQTGQRSARQWNPRARSAQTFLTIKCLGEGGGVRGMMGGEGEAEGGGVGVEGAKAPGPRCSPPAPLRSSNSRAAISHRQKHR